MRDMDSMLGSSSDAPIPLRIDADAFRTRDAAMVGRPAAALGPLSNSSF